MAKFRGFESFEVYADGNSIFIEQNSYEAGEAVIVEIPIHMWELFVKAAEFEIEQAGEQ